MKKTQKNKNIEELKARLLAVSHLSSILALLDWDQNVHMPKKAADARAASIGELSTIIHGKVKSLDYDGLLTNLKKDLDAGKLKGQDMVIVRETWRSFDRVQKLPEKFIRELAETTSKAHQVWAEAREKKDFKRFAPTLEKIIALKKKEAAYIGYTESPYDPLLDAHEPDMKASEATEILEDLKQFLIPFVQKITAAKVKVKENAIKGKFPMDKQIAFNELVLQTMGFDFDAGNFAKTVHPFAAGLHPNDVRITTRYAHDDIFYSLFTTIHEAGHGLYDQGLLPEHFGTPIAESISIGIHESQSKTWENHIGKDIAFWKYFYPKLQKEFPKPFKKLSLTKFYRIINVIKPSFIRVESDEVTYNLHIILRFEIEKGLIEGTIKVKDLPKVWNAKMKEYFGIVPPHDALGVLQDVHWSIGAIGYFPTYSFGNLYAAQFYTTMEKAIPDMHKRIAKGDFAAIRSWLRTHIHTHGKTYSAKDLVKKVTGEELTSKHFITYLKNKYEKLYLK